MHIFTTVHKEEEKHEGREGGREGGTKCEHVKKDPQDTSFFFDFHVCVIVYFSMCVI